MTPSVDIPVMRGNEATYITLNTKSDDPEIIWDYFVLGSSGYIMVDNERMEIREHLLVPRERYPEPPKWDGRTVIEETEYRRVVATVDGIGVAVADAEYGDLPEEDDVTIPWADVLKHAPIDSLADVLKHAPIESLVDALKARPDTVVYQPTGETFVQLSPIPPLPDGVDGVCSRATSAGAEDLLVIVRGQR